MRYIINYDQIDPLNLSKELSFGEGDVRYRNKGNSKITFNPPTGEGYFSTSVLRRFEAG